MSEEHEGQHLINSGGQLSIIAPYGAKSTKQLHVKSFVAAPGSLKLLRLEDVPAAVRDAMARLLACWQKPPPPNTIQELKDNGVLVVKGPSTAEVRLFEASRVRVHQGKVVLHAVRHHHKSSSAAWLNCAHCIAHAALCSAAPCHQLLSIPHACLHISCLSAYHTCSCLFSAQTVQ